MRLILVALVALNIVVAAWQLLMVEPGKRRSLSLPPPVYANAGSDALVLAVEIQGAASGSRGALYSGISAGSTGAGRGAGSVMGTEQALSASAPVLAQLLRSSAEFPPTDAGSQADTLGVESAQDLHRGVDFETSVLRHSVNCIKAGPLESAAQAQELLKSMESFAGEGEVIPQDQIVRSVFRVHVPPRSSRADANSVVNALKKKGVESFVINEQGPIRSGVSLGVFHDEESAKRMIQKMGDLGYPVKIHRSTQLQTGYFVSARVAGDSSAGIPRALVGLIRQFDAEALVQDVPCAGVAIAPSLH